MRTPGFLALLALLSACGKASDGGLPHSSASAALKPAALSSVSAGDPQPSGTLPAPNAPSPQVTIVQQALSVANDVRRKNGLSVLKIDPQLAAVAQAQAEDMLKRHYFEHNTPEGVTPFQRMDKAGVQYAAAAENIALGVTDPQKVFDLWLSSPGHRHNLLNNIYGRQGIGYAGGYWVHDFTD